VKITSWRCATETGAAWCKPPKFIFRPGRFFNNQVSLHVYVLYIRLMRKYMDIYLSSSTFNHSNTLRSLVISVVNLLSSRHKYRFSSRPCVSNSIYLSVCRMYVGLIHLPGFSMWGNAYITCGALALSTVLRTASLSYENMRFSGTHRTKTP
jgi:hypothetical protein